MIVDIPNKTENKEKEVLSIIKKRIAELKHDSSWFKRRIKAINKEYSNNINWSNNYNDNVELYAKNQKQKTFAINNLISYYSDEWFDIILNDKTSIFVSAADIMLNTDDVKLIKLNQIAYVHWCYNFKDYDNISGELKFNNYHDRNLYLAMTLDRFMYK